MAGLRSIRKKSPTKAGNQPIEQKDYIGTGPYKFVDWRPNRYVEVEKFDGYKPVQGKGRRLSPAPASPISTRSGSFPCRTSARA